MTANPLPSELHTMVDAACADAMSEADLHALAAMLSDSPEAQQVYLKYCRMHVELFFCCGEERLNQTILDDIRAEKAASPATPLPSILAAPISPAINYFSSGWPVAYLVATVIVAIGLVVGAFVRVSQPSHLVTPSSPHPSRLSPFPAAVARITGLVDCVWEGPAAANQESEIRNQKSVLHLGDRLALKSGLLEITYDTGARAILQGPVRYKVESPAGGYLSVGKLTARLDSRSEISNLKSQIPNQKSEISNHKFVVRTPTALVTDLGTEFGVEVDKNGITRSHVFRGTVKVQMMDDRGIAFGSAQLLRANESAQVDVRGKAGKIVVGVSVPSNQFVREISRKTKKPPVPFDVIAHWQFDGEDFLADSSGHGHTLVNHGVTQVDQAAAFDGKAMLSTVDAIDLTPYNRIRVSWRQKTALPDSDQVVWEHGSNFNTKPGAIAMVLEKGKAHAGIRSDVTSPTDGDHSDGYNVDQYSVLTNTWETLAVEFDRTAYRANVVRVFKNGMEIAATTFFDGFAPKSFVNAAFHIGARDGSKAPFTGQIDDLRIEGEITTNRQ